jgi:hypothetical protein
VRFRKLPPTWCGGFLHTTFPPPDLFSFLFPLFSVAVFLVFILAEVLRGFGGWVLFTLGSSSVQPFEV